MDIHKAIDDALKADRSALDAKNAAADAASLANSADTRAHNAWNDVYKALKEIGAGSPTVKRTDLGHCLFPERIKASVEIQER